MASRRSLAPVGLVAALAGAGRLVYRLVVSGALTLDTGTGRRVRPLGPVTIEVDAPRQVVFDVLAAPYGRHPPRAVAEHVEVLERADGMVLAAHRTAVGRHLVATTVETVRFDPPAEIWFRLVRGPVPHVVEVFRLEPVGEGTRVTYEGHLGTDFGRLGARWGDLVAARWVAAVERSLADAREAAEQRAAARARRDGADRTS